MFYHIYEHPWEHMFPLVLTIDLDIVQPVMHQDLWILQQQMRPDLADTKMRVNTFKDWPHGDSHPPERMAAAGFYYTGEHFGLLVSTV